MKDDRGELDLDKKIEQSKIQMRFFDEQLQIAANRIKDLEEINEAHRKLNGTLRVEIQELKKSQYENEKNKNLLQGYKKVIQDLSTRLVK